MYKVGDKVLVKATVEKVADDYVRIYAEGFGERNFGLTYAPVVNKTYEQGLADSWNLLKKVYDMKCETIEQIFDVEGGFWDVIRDFTYKEALAKIEAYEREKEIKVGDVVVIDDDVNALVIDEISEESVFVLTENGCIETRTKKYLEKTDKKISISDLLRQIGE